MVVIMHIIVAFLGIFLTSYAYVRPSSALLKSAYGAVGLTLMSGIYLVWTAPAHMLQACLSGLIYVGIVSIGIAAARAKLARQKAALR